MHSMRTSAGVHLLLAVLATPCVAWTISENFDGLTAGNNCDPFGTTAMVVSTDQAFSGAQSCKNTSTLGETGFGQWGGIIDFPSVLSEGDEIWVRVRVYWPSGFDYDADPRLKFLRIRVRTSAGGHVGYNDLYINPSGYPNADENFSWIFEGEGSWIDLDNSGTDVITFDTWETYEMYLKLDAQDVDESGTARIRIWKDGTLIGDITSRRTLNADTDEAFAFYLFTYWNGGAPATQSMYIDDVEITNETPSDTDGGGNPFIGTGAGAPEQQTRRWFQ